MGAMNGMRPAGGIDGSGADGSGGIGPDVILKAAESFGSPVYLYDERALAEACGAVLSMPNAFGLSVRYAMKANPNRTLLKLICGLGLSIDASSLNEARRANMAGMGFERIMLTTQEAPEGDEMRALEEMMRRGLKYNVCSLRQLYNITDFAAENGIGLSMRVHPGIGSGESVTRNTGDDYSCFGVHLSDIEKALDFARGKGLRFDCVHTHIGSGGDPAAWRSNVDLELKIAGEYFPEAETVNFGGGLKVARMPDEKAADIQALGEYARGRVEDFYRRTGRKLRTEIEPGTYIAANAGYLILRVTDKKRTGADGYNFIILNGGMELNTRPLLYGSRHPFYIVSKSGELKFSEFGGGTAGSRDTAYEAAVVGRCCESGDSQSLAPDGRLVPRALPEPDIGDLFVVGGTGAYCSAMSLVNYNSHVQAPEVLYTRGGELIEIRRRQTLEQLTANEL